MMRPVGERRWHRPDSVRYDFRFSSLAEMVAVHQAALRGQ